MERKNILIDHVNNIMKRGDFMYNEDFSWEDAVDALQSYVDKIIELLNKNPEKLRSYIEEQAELDYDLMLLKNIWPNMVIEAGNELCNVIALSKESYPSIKKYIEKLIKRIRKEVKRPNRPHLQGYLREVLAQLFEVLSRINYCGGESVESIRAKVDALKFRGIALKIRGHYEEAINLFEKAISELNSILSNYNINEKLKNQLEQDKAYLMALKYETQAQATLYEGGLEDATKLFNEASKYYRLSGDNNSSLWSQGCALALESLIIATKGDIQRSIKLMSHIRSNIYPKIKDSINKLFGQQRIRLDRLFGISMISIVSHIAYNYWEFLGSAYEFLLDKIYEHQGFTLLPRSIAVEGKKIEVDLNAIRYDEGILFHVVGECKITLDKHDIRKFADKVNIISSYVSESPILCPKGYSYRLLVVIVANFDVSKVNKNQVKELLNKYIEKIYETKILDTTELEQLAKKTVRESALYSIIRNK